MLVQGATTQSYGSMLSLSPLALKISGRGPFTWLNSCNLAELISLRWKCSTQAGELSVPSQTPPGNTEDSGMKLDFGVRVKSRA